MSEEQNKIDDLRTTMTKTETEVRFLEKAFHDLRSSHQALERTMTHVNSVITKLDQILTSQEQSVDKIEAYMLNKILGVETSIKDHGEKVSNLIREQKASFKELLQSQQLKINEHDEKIAQLQKFMWKAAAVGFALLIVMSILETYLRIVP